MTGMPHEFDSSQTCNYCSIAAEKTKPGDLCPKRSRKVIDSTEKRYISRTEATAARETGAALQFLREYLHLKSRLEEMHRQVHASNKGIDEALQVVRKLCYGHNCIRDFLTKEDYKSCYQTFDCQNPTEEEIRTLIDMVERVKT